MSDQRIDNFTDEITRFCFELLDLKKNKVECKHCLFEMLVAWNYAITNILYDAFQTEDQIEDFLSSVGIFCEIKRDETYKGQLN